MGDLDALVDMGFDREKSVLALKHGGGLQGAIDYLDTNADKSIEELRASSTTTTSSSTTDPDGGPPLQAGEEPRSLVCNDCGKRFRSTAQAEFHASKTEHQDFSESTEEIAPLTEEQKAAKLEELRARLAAKRAGQGEEEAEGRRRNEAIRKKHTQEAADAKEALEKKEQLKEAAAKKREKLDALDAKKRVQARIAADKEERRLRAEKERAQREQQTFPADAVQDTLPASSAAAAAVPATAKASTDYKEARLRLQTTNGALQKNFAAETTLFEVAHAVAEEKGLEVQSFQSNFPRKTWERTDFGMTLREAGLVPSAALVVK